MVKIAPEISLVITTYNSPVFLELVLKSVLRQRVFPLEVIIADDGSGEETRQLIEHYKEIMPVPLIHSWIPDKGFRVAKSRNLAISKTSGKYIVLIDGDIVVGPSFIKDHRSLMKLGQFVTGSRARLGKKATEERCRTKNAVIHIWSKGLGRRLVLMRIPFMHHLIKGKRGLSHARSCHMAFWKEDFIKINGFEENFEGWGYEDSELVQRFYNIGLHRKNAKLLACATHLYHPEKSMDRADKNHDMLNQTIASKKKKAVLGINQYLHYDTENFAL